MNRNFYLTFLGLMCIPTFLCADGYNPTNNWISFTTDTPPALMYITDSQGNMSGADPTLPLDQYGRQGDHHSGLEQIPGSDAEQDNETNPNTGLPKSITTWTVTIPDSVTTSYTIHLIGTKNSYDSVLVSAGFITGQKNFLKQNNNVLLSTGVTQTMTVSFNATNHTASGLTVQRVVANGGLLSDIKSACAIGLIEPRECEFLTLKAEKIEKASDHKNDDEAVVLLKSFLCNLGLLKGDGDDDRDDRNAIKEPAYGIIRSDVVALLKTLSKRDERFHFFDFDHFRF